MCHAPDALPAISRGPHKVTHANQFVLESSGGARSAAYAAWSSGGCRAGVVVLPDQRGLSGFYVALVTRLAEYGFSAVAIDYFGRTAGVRNPADSTFPFMEHLVRTRRENIQADVAAAAAYLRSAGSASCKAVSVLGFCFGARQAWLAAAADVPLAGAVGFYGAPGFVLGTTGPTQVAHRITAPILALMGGADEGIPPADVAAFDAALRAAGVPHEVVTYPGAPHSFFDLHQAEHVNASADAWRRVVEFLAGTSRMPPCAAGGACQGELR